MVPDGTLAPTAGDPAEPRRRSAWQRLNRDRVAMVALMILLAMVLLCLLAPWVTPFDPLKQNLLDRFQGPTAKHWLGTDEFGRDVASRILYGGRMSLLMGLSAVTFGITFGMPLGLLAGFFRRLDNPIMRLMDVILAFPRLLLAIALVAALGPGVYSAILAVSVGTVPIFCRLVRSTVLSVRELDYVLVARALGQTEGRIILRHVLPNCLAPVVVYATVTFGQAILLAAMLSFLGLGVQPPQPEWGALINQGRKYLTLAPHLSIFPGLMIFITVLCFNTLGDGLRDVLDPRLR